MARAVAIIIIASMLRIEYEYSSMLRSLDRDLSTGQVRVYKSAAPRHTMFILSMLDLQITARKAKIFII